VIAAAVLLLLSLAPGPFAVQAPPAGCSEWRDCRQQALAAADLGDYQTFHDLAWRAVQTGPPRDTSLMYLLARAQALSGRPHDALVMLGRLADMGVVSDALTNPDFERTRALRDWPDVAQRIEHLTSPQSASTPSAASKSGAASPVASSSAAARPAGAASTRAGAPAAAPVSTAPASVPPASPTAAAAPAGVEAARFTARRFSPGGLAYDTVSRRFLVGDRLDRKLIVVGDGANHADDLVRSDSAGFQQLSAMDVDTRRGDLWVASTAAEGGAATLHKLQLVSGRPLKTFPVSADARPVNFVDLATTSSGSVLVLDAAGSRLFVLRPGEAALKTFVPLKIADATSVAGAAEDGTAYVAHAAGIIRVDLRARTTSAVRMPKAAALGRLERIRSYRNALIAVEVDESGSRRIVRLDLNASGRAAAKATTIEALAPASGETFVSVSGDELLYLSAVPAATDVVTYRVRLR
jgi:hypothetical protein